MHLKDRHALQCYLSAAQSIGNSSQTGSSGFTSHDHSAGLVWEENATRGPGQNSISSSAYACWRRSLPAPRPRWWAEPSLPRTWGLRLVFDPLPRWFLQTCMSLSSWQRSKTKNVRILSAWKLSRKRAERPYSLGLQDCCALFSLRLDLISTDRHISKTRAWHLQLIGTIRRQGRESKDIWVFSVLLKPYLHLHSLLNPLRQTDISDLIPVVEGKKFLKGAKQWNSLVHHITTNMNHPHFPTSCFECPTPRWRRW